MFLSGLVSSRFDMMVVGASGLFAATSAYLTSYVKSEHRVKRTLEVIFMLLAFGVVIYGYVVTRSLILGVITLFIVAMTFAAFTLSYILPRIRGKSESPS